MTATRPRNDWHWILLAACAAVSLACSGSSSNENGVGGAGGSGAGGGGAGGSSVLDSNGFGREYKLADNEVPGWTQDTGANAFAVYDKTNLVDRIDGPATIYVDKGMKFALYQTLNGPDGRICSLTAMLFDSEAGAKSMFDLQRNQTSADLAIAPYDSSVAAAYTTLFGINVLAYFKALYLEVGMDGYGNPPDVATSSQDAAAVLKAMAAKNTSR